MTVIVVQQDFTIERIDAGTSRMFSTIAGTGRHRKCGDKDQGKAGAFPARIELLFH